MKFDNEFNEVKIRHIIIIWLLAVVILIAVMFFMPSNSDGEFSKTNINILCLMADILFFIMLVYVTKPSREKINFLYRDFRKKLNIKEIILVTFLLICLNVGGAKIIVDIVYVISPRLANEFINNNVLTINSITDYCICFVILVILSPIVDELTFRYTLFKRITKKFNIYVGFIVSSIIFSAINIQPEIIGTLALAIVNCILYVKYENILIPMLLYSLNNLFSILVFVPLGELKDRTINYTSNDLIVNALLGIALFIFGTTFLIKFVFENKIYLRNQFNKCSNIE